ncbi:unnamed protein product [Paramecium octaurelia]|uniref:Uncharacterized protein n=1 Tax=Paramecium octaurelia TaxID=43137 RepID=A0A8S1XKU8_PAROT|nr:unnamed protein product [Paramecium octaurelia]
MRSDEKEQYKILLQFFHTQRRRKQREQILSKKRILDFPQQQSVTSEYALLFLNGALTNYNNLQTIFSKLHQFLPKYSELHLWTVPYIFQQQTNIYRILPHLLFTAIIWIVKYHNKQCQKYFIIQDHQPIRQRWNLNQEIYQKFGSDTQLNKRVQEDQILCQILSNLVIDLKKPEHIYQSVKLQ